ncbi:hypothetical protein SAMN05444280_105103 [Tangfeifania diversioriginum]|uniref:Uncharacterized protein n=1 Tax=Tangfeifania diversioriginum TaxID=1168035 RepID=A0A1M6DLY7_9BACT|nr:hypothetical protein SAMN05444280_105103 [Tangfeifania diversioriginum]
MVCSINNHKSNDNKLTLILTFPAKDNKLITE